VRHVNLGKMDSLHLDSSSFHVDGNYINNTACEEAQPELKFYGYSRDHRPDLKQFILDLMQWDGDIPLYLRVGDGNESDSAMFATPPRGLQTASKSMPYLWRMPHFTRKRICNKCFICVGCREYQAPWLQKTLLENMPEEAFNDSVISGYHCTLL